MSEPHTIGEVLNELKREFEDITISKIRFLEAEGLISPDRTDSGYRQFTEADIDRLRYVLQAQRDRYLPLKVIKEELERLDAGLPVDASPPTPDEDAVELVVGHDDPGNDPGSHEPLSLSLEELAEAAELTVQSVRQLRDHGLLADEGPYDRDDLTVTAAAGELLELGLEPRHLRMYRQFVDRQLGLANQLVSALVRQRNPEARERAQEQLEVLAEQGGRLHRGLLDSALDDLLRS